MANYIVNIRNIILTNKIGLRLLLQIILNILIYLLPIRSKISYTIFRAIELFVVITIKIVVKFFGCDHLQ